MKNILLISATLLLAPLLSFGADQTWTGEISDAMCGASHAAMGEMGKNARNCTLYCVKNGNQYVFVSKGQVFQIANQTLPDLEKHAGHKVQLTGSLGSDKQTITVAKAEMPH